MGYNILGEGGKNVSRVEAEERTQRALGAGGRGLVMVYTGNGKGKTTAAFGLALRAVGHGAAVYVVQFLKGPERMYGEAEAAQRYLGEFLTVVQSGRDEFVNRLDPSPEDRELARQGLELARRAMLSGRYQMVVLDEVNVALDYGLLSLRDVLDLIDDRPPQVDLVLTGRHAPAELLARADMVSEVREVKHHYQRGIGARPGIEF